MRSIFARRYQQWAKQEDKTEVSVKAEPEVSQEIDNEVIPDTEEKKKGRKKKE